MITCKCETRNFCLLNFLFQLTKRLKNGDRKNAIWEMKSIAITQHRNSDFKIFEAIIVGYNTRLSEEDVLRRAANVLGSKDRDDHELMLFKLYDSG